MVLYFCVWGHTDGFVFLCLGPWRWYCIFVFGATQVVLYFCVWGHGDGFGFLCVCGHTDGFGFLWLGPSVFFWGGGMELFLDLSLWGHGDVFFIFVWGHGDVFVSALGAMIALSPTT